MEFHFEILRKYIIFLLSYLIHYFITRIVLFSTFIKVDQSKPKPLDHFDRRSAKYIEERKDGIQLHNT